MRSASARTTDDRQPEGLGQELRELRGAVREHGVLAVGRRFVDDVGRNEVLTYASAMSYQVLFALVPVALAAVALLGFLSLGDVWSERIAPQVAERTSEAAFDVIDSTVERILGAKRGFWLTAGVALALWELSGAVRTVMGALDRIYGVERSRSALRRYGVSFALAAALGPLLLLALASAQVLPRASKWLGGSATIDVVALVVGWGLSIVLLLTAVWLLVRYAPSRRPPLGWAGAASLAVVALWSIASAGFGFYATTLASYGSIFGSAAFAIVLMTYVYISAVAFLAGIQLDAFVRAAGPEPG